MNRVRRWFAVATFLVGAPACTDAPEEASDSVQGLSSSSDVSNATASPSPEQVNDATSTPAAPISIAAVVFVNHVQSGRCLDGSISQGVRLNTCNGGTFQEWNINGFEFRHLQSGRCLDGSVSQGVRLDTCNGSTFQQWGTTTGSDVVHVQSGRCLDGSISQGVRLNTCNGGTFQQWTFF